MMTIEKQDRMDGSAEKEKLIQDALLREAFSGGVLMCYREEGYPIFYVNDSLWKSLGFVSEEQYLQSNQGIFLNSVHPDDRQRVTADIDRQLLESNTYSTEYRKRNGEGVYIWVREYGKQIAAPDGKEVLSCLVFDITERKNTQAQLDNIINTLPFGMAKYRYHKGMVELLFQSDGIGALTGRTREEYSALIAGGLANALYPEDVPGVIKALEASSKTDHTVSISYRAPHKNGGYVWLTTGLRRTEIENGAAIIHAVMTPLSFQSELYQMLVNESDTGIIVRDNKTFELLYTNKTACEMLHVEHGRYTGQKCYEFFFQSAVPCDFCDSEKERRGSLTRETLYIPPLDQYFTRKSAIVDWAGREASVEYLDDVTELEKSHRRIDDLLQNVPCGICLYRWDGKNITPVLCNSRFAELFSKDGESYFKSTEHLQFSHAHPDDIESLQQAVHTGLMETHRIDHTYRAFNDKAGQYFWIRLRGAALQQPDKSWFIYVSYIDVTQEHLTQQKLLENERILEHAADMAGISYWTYDLELDRAYLDARNQAIFDLPAVVDNFLETWQKRRFLHPDYVDIFIDAFQQVRAGEKNVTVELRHHNKDGSLHWVRFLLVRLDEGSSLSPIVICTAVPIDAEKELHVKYELEKRKPSLGENTLLVHALFNLTTDKTIEYQYQDGTMVPQHWRTAFVPGRDYLDSIFIDDEERRQYRALNDKRHLLACYEKGETELSIEYRRRLRSGEIVWVRNILHLVRDPGSSDVLLFEYCYDVDEEKTQDLLYRSLATDGYDYVVKINGKTHGCTMMHSQQAGGNLPAQGMDTDALSRWMAERVVPEDRVMLTDNLSVEQMQKNLRNRERFQFSCRMTGSNHEIQYKKITQFYLDRQRELLVLVLEDVSGLVRTEMEKNTMLASALEAANQASRAKSQFLSRMSHELRTPMNAIIGLSALAAGDVENTAVMEDTIGKIGLSARYLLSLINDILEMSRIESGRLTLNEGPFDFEELISSVNGIIFGQAHEKGVDYDAVVNSFTESIYIGDAIKLQQILVNVLSNAVKFTPAGGKITFAIEQLRRSNDRAVLRFVVSDTGVGIDEDFIPHLFDPFAQESASFTSTSTGTGLGLAITKNMVEMMNGHIRVQSIKNVGSTFTIEVQLGISEESRTHLDMISSMNLSRLRTLIVDDDVLVCQSTEKTLSAMGIQAEWVDSGLRAVERVQISHAENNDYDTIFIDWKMPDMDGIETTRQIRRIVGPDTTIVIITAYDWKAIEIEARAAGVNMFMDKPLFQSSIVNAFERIFSTHKKKIIPKPKQDYSFVGRRVLLAEDQPLNVEVAKRLLEKTGAEVIVANTGLEALEAFATSETGHFDAILMDVRMPIMDGLTAARSIRNLKKTGSKTIPIIAMTANAFDEDVKQSLANGMDAHLTKPIDPQILFSTLQKLLKR